MTRGTAKVHTPRLETRGNVMTERDQRIRDLYRTPKRALAAYYREHSGYVWAAVPPERWSKNQLVSDILRLDEETVS
jgi:hypothetical protein